MAWTVFIDGKEGTTGLRIFDRLAERGEFSLLTLPEEKRKDADARREAIHAADIAILCLPDAAARESVALAEGSKTRILDTSTAHRVAPGWAYGFPELSKKHRDAVVSGQYVAVPGCHASGFIALAAPLVAAGLIPADALLSCFSLTGYSGGGKKMIAEYESEDKSSLLFAPRQYGLTQQHKHLKEMKGITGIENAPIFCPVVDDFYSGMQVTVPLFAEQINCSSSEIADIYRAKYQGPVVTFCDKSDNGGFLCAGALSGTDGMKISVYGNDERILLTAVYDNLGKGASGAALENLNLVMGKDKAFGLDI